MLLAGRDWTGHAVLDTAVFPLAALILNYLLYRARLLEDGRNLVTMAMNG